jgi:hypothetical protein
MPEEGLDFSPHPDLLTFDKFVRVAHVARGLGITAVRITRWGAARAARTALFGAETRRPGVRRPDHDDERHRAGEVGAGPCVSRPATRERELRLYGRNDSPTSAGVEARAGYSTRWTRPRKLG